MWQDMLHTAVLEIMSYLPHYHLVSAGLVCRRWHSLSQDSLLWKAFLTRRFNLAPSISLRPGAESWRREFIRMTDEVPSVLTDLPGSPPTSPSPTPGISSACVTAGKASAYGGQPIRVRECRRYRLSGGRLRALSSIPRTVFFWSLAVLLTRRRLDAKWWPSIRREGQVKADCSFPCDGWVTDSAFLTTEAMDWDFRRVYLNTADPFDNEMNSDITLISDDVLHPDSQSMTFCSIRDGFPKMMFQLGTLDLYKEGSDDVMGDRSWHLAPTRIGMVGDFQDLSRHTYSHDFDIFTPSDEKFPHMLIAGFCPSPDHEMCYVNVRPLTRNVEFENNSIFPFVLDSHEDLRIYPLNLTSMTAGPPLTRHKGVAHSNLDWTESERLFPDVTNCYVGCGSVDGRGYVWDRHYGCHVSILSGTFKNPPEFPRWSTFHPRVPHMLNLLGIEEEPPTVETEEEHNRPSVQDFLIDKSKATDEGNAATKDEGGENQDKESDVVEAEDEATVNDNLMAFEYEEDEDNQPVISVALNPKREDVMVTVGKNGRIKVFRSKKWARENKFGYKISGSKTN